MAVLIDELLNTLFDGQPHLLSAPMATWLNSSRRFTAFVDTYQTKIRKKLRTAQEREKIRDLQLELQTAYLLLREQSLGVAYETQHPREGRSPDFAVTFTTSLTFMVEVTRLRTSFLPPPDDRFTDALCSKLGQLQPQHSNLLVVGIEASLPTQDELQSTMLRIQRRAENNDPAVVQGHGFRDRADFFRHYRRLSALLVREIDLKAPVILWNNAQAKYPLPAKVRTALSRSHTL